MAPVMENQQPPRPTSQKLPVSGILNAPEDHPQRDSAYFTDASSKHTSAASFGLANSTMSTYGSASDKTPSPIAPTTSGAPMVSPTPQLTVGSVVSPTKAGSTRLDGPSSISVTGGLESESRRESVDSRMNQNFGELKIESSSSPYAGSNSPYASQNHSTSSFHVLLPHQRNARPGFDGVSSVQRISNGYQPNAERTPDGQGKNPRTAPAITGPTNVSIAHAAEPVKGQAWAFPEPGATTSGHGHYGDSRRSSVADSLGSSQFTSELRLPPGQRRLQEVGQDFTPLFTPSSELPAVHHHTLQNRQLGDLKNDESSAQSGSQPYSRTPELRISHKLAERKRRTEMKELFEQLRDLMPQERGSKASKWEILTKAIQEHKRNAEATRYWTSHCQGQQVDIDNLRRELHKERSESERLRQQVVSLRTEIERFRRGLEVSKKTAPPSGPAYPNSDDYARPPRPELPPLRNVSTGTGPESMTGVQYDGPRPQGSFPPRTGQF